MIAILMMSAFAASATAPAASPAESRKSTVRVAAIQCSSDLGAVQANRAKLTQLVEQAAAGGAKIIVLPEAAITGYVSQDMKTNWRLPGRPIEPEFTGKDPLPFAETVPGPSTVHFCELARRLHVYVTIPLVEVESVARVTHESPVADPVRGVRGPSVRLFNTVCLASPAGELVAHYRKLTPWPIPEKSWATAGDRGVQTYDTEYGRVGLAICYDIHTILEKYEPQHLWALLYPIAWVDETHPAEWFWHSLPQRLRPFGFHVIGANWSVDRRPDWHGYGFSTIYERGGGIVASAKSLYGSEIVYAELATVGQAEALRDLPGAATDTSDSDRRTHPAAPDSD